MYIHIYTCIFIYPNDPNTFGPLTGTTCLPSNWRGPKMRTQGPKGHDRWKIM